jgi:hypothetical protein
VRWTIEVALFAALTKSPTQKVIRAKAAVGLTADQLFGGTIGRKGDWVTWARRLYTGLTQLKSDGVSDSGLRIVIEEAGLTAIGTQVLQKRLKSLRFQKTVMQPPIVKADDAGFRSVLIVARAATRLLRATGRYETFPGFAKCSKWSRMRNDDTFRE